MTPPVERNRRCRVSGPGPTTAATRRCAPTCSLGGRDGRPGRLLSVPSTSTSTPPSPCSPATATGCSPANCPATNSPPPTGSGDTSWTTPAPSPSPTTTSASTSRSAPTPQCSSTPASPNSTSLSPGGADEASASGSHHAEPQPNYWNSPSRGSRLNPAKKIHLILDNGSSHTSTATRTWLADHPRFTVTYTPKHASWLNIVEIFFSILTRRMLRRGEFTSRQDLADKILKFIEVYNRTAKPFRWSYDAKLLKAA